MSYEPRIIAKRQDLLKIQSELEEEQYSDNLDIARIAKEILSTIDSYIDFESIEIVIFRPEFTTFNSLVRERLDEGGVYYKTDN
jgi:hypothetical protein